MNLKRINIGVNAFFNLNVIHIKSDPLLFIVDDDIDDIELFCEALSEIYPDSVCFDAKSGKNCLKLLRQQPTSLPDFIFLDLNMQPMDGRSCLDKLKKDVSLKNIPVIIYTTSQSQKDRDETLQMGAAYFLTKPSSFKGLCEGIKGAFEAVNTTHRSKC